jgi:hypothetical protein
LINQIEINNHLRIQFSVRQFRNFRFTPHQRQPALFLASCLAWVHLERFPAQPRSFRFSSQNPERETVATLRVFARPPEKQKIAQFQIAEQQRFLGLLLTPSDAAEPKPAVAAVKVADLWQDALLAHPTHHAGDDGNSE